MAYVFWIGAAKVSTPVAKASTWRLFQIIKIPDCQGPKSYTFYYSAFKDWNCLPEKQKTIQNHRKFKFELKTFLQLHNQSKDEVVYIHY